MIVTSENKTHAATCQAAELTRQNGVSAAIAAGGTSAAVQKAIQTAEVAFYRSVIASCVASNVEAEAFRQGLHDLTGQWA